MINFENRISDDLYILVNTLIENGSINNNWEDISHVLEKPHHYKKEYEEIVETEKETNDLYSGSINIICIKCKQSTVKEGNLCDDCLTKQYLEVRQKWNTKTNY